MKRVQHPAPPPQPQSASPESSSARRCALSSFHRRAIIAWSAVYLLCLIYVAAAYFFPHATGSIVRCPLYTLTGIRCPTCGLTRAAMALLHGQIGEAISHNLLIIPVALLTVAFPIAVASDIFLHTRLIPGAKFGK